MMRYFYRGEAVIAFNELQVKQGLADDLTELTPEQLETHLNPPTAPKAVPEVVSKAQGKAVLVQEGLWQAVLDYVDNIEDSTEKTLAEIALNDTQEWRRSSPLLNSMATALGLSGEVLDGLFVTAASIEF